MLPLIALVGAACATTGRVPVPYSLRTQVLARIAEVPGAQVGLYLHDLATHETLGIDDTVTFHAASTMKVPVMVELMRQVDTAAVTLEDRIPLVNTFASIIDGSPYRLSRDGDSDPAIYDRIGAPITYRELNERMIVRSSNLATNVLIERLDPTRITATARALVATLPADGTSFDFMRDFARERGQFGNVHLVEVERTCSRGHAFVQKDIARTMATVERREHRKGIDTQPVPAPPVEQVRVADEIRMVGSKIDIETLEIGREQLEECSILTVLGVRLPLSGSLEPNVSVPGPAHRAAERYSSDGRSEVHPHPRKARPQLEITTDSLMRT